ncbi:ABC transporter permease [Halostella sp. JP-L12]|uniref:ABC transporter permease n=1 Tax=Halostella TaxID=1843185 RepID=UPI000EF7B15E|nr:MULTISPECIES: ABC transporter permease [Halostella]NHN47739.1 ABC transporter permease [Halostella sp. JP-L12]
MSETTEESGLGEESTTAEPFRRDWNVRRLVRGVAGIAGFLAVWWALAGTQPPYILPGPASVAETFVAELRSGAMLDALSQSVRHWAPGTLVGTVLGVALGVVMGWSTLADDAFTPVVRVLRPVPPIALIGFAIAWFGINHAGAAFIVAAGGFWINFYATYGGVENVSEELVEVARSLGVRSDLGLVRKVVLPAALPEILTGVRTGIGRCWMLVVAAELFGVPGIGQTIIRASNNLAVDVVIAYILVLSLMFLLVDSTFRSLQRRALAWQ